MSGDEEFFIEPLAPADNLTSVAEREERPHVVYKRSSLRHQYMDQSCGVIGEWSRRCYWLTRRRVTDSIGSLDADSQILLAHWILNSWVSSKPSAFWLQEVLDELQ